MSDGFFPPILMSFVFQTPDLKPFSKKKVKLEQIVCNNRYFEVAFSDFFIAQVVHKTNYFPGDM